MKNTILMISLPMFIFLCCSPLAVCAPDYNDFPENLQWVLDKRIEQLEDKGGFCIAGRVTFNDQSQIYDHGDVQINISDRLSVPLQVYYDGWFINNKTLIPVFLSEKGGGLNRKIVGRAFQYDPIDIDITVEEGKITYLDFEMTRTPNEKLGDVNGTVLDENGLPFEGAAVSLFFPLAHFPESVLRTFSREDGTYSFNDVVKTKYSVMAKTAGYADDRSEIKAWKDSSTTIKLQHFPHRKIFIECIYQPDGSGNFQSEDLAAKQLYWEHSNVWNEGVLFSEAAIVRNYNDMKLEQRKDVMYFRKYYGKFEYKTGLYDNGLVEFDSVLKADEDISKYARGSKCQVGHVYVVRTYEGPNYAKFIVLTDEYSFRTVNPAGLRPYEFKGYGLKINIKSCSDVGKVYASKFYDAPDGLDIPYLPYYWEISGLDGLNFNANLEITYDEQDVKKLNLSEESLSIYQYNEIGDVWQKISSRVDTSKNIIYAENVSKWGIFSVGVE